MPIETGLQAILAGEATINTLLRTTSSVYIGQAPQQETGPYIEIHVLGFDPYLHLGTTGGMGASTIDIDCKGKMGANGDVPRAIADAVQAFIDDYSGAAGDHTIDAVLLENRKGEVEQPDGKQERGRWVETIDVMIQWH